MALLPDLPGYEVRGRLAVGGMAEIWRARALDGALAGQEVALKRLLPAHRSQAAYVELFLDEARLGALAAHEHIVRTHDLFRAGRDYFIVQELLTGATLGQLRDAARARGGRMPVAAACIAVNDLLEALAHLHGGAGRPGQPPILHRDVNPDNLVASPLGSVKLVDFGVAEVQGQRPRVRTGSLRGTPAYMSPEQVKARPLDARSDLFSAGIVLWELLANRPLFQQDHEFETLRWVCEVTATPLRQVDPSLPSAFERLAARALARDPERRFQAAAEFQQELLEACAREGVALDREVLGVEVRRVAPGPP